MKNEEREIQSSPGQKTQINMTINVRKYGAVITEKLSKLESVKVYEYLDFRRDIFQNMFIVTKQK